MKKKIGIDARMYSTGFTGIGRYVAELVANLAELDRENEYVIFLNPTEFEKFSPPAANFRKVRVDARHYSLAEQTKFLAAVNAEKLDLMHFTHFNAPLFYRHPTIVTIHDLTLSKFPGQKMTSWLHRTAYNLVLRRSTSHASQIIAVSTNTKNDLVEILKTPPEKIDVVMNGIGEEFTPAADREATLAAVQQKFGLTGDFLLYAGVWRDHKNLLGLIEAFAKIKIAGELVITGREDPVYAPAIFEAVERFGVKNRVKFVGLVSEADLLDLLRTARVFVFPSFYEGFGLPILEAMACGTPVAASNSSSIPEVAGGAAELFDPKNVAEIAGKIEKAWSDKNLREKLIAAGFARVRDFSWRKMAEETLTAYKNAISKIEE